MNLNKIEMFGDWVLVEIYGPHDEGIVVKSGFLHNWDEETSMPTKRPIIPISTKVRFRGEIYNTKLLPFTEDGKTYVAVHYEDIIYKEIK